MIISAFILWGISVQPFWISREPVTWPWCNLAASQRRPCCASVNNHCPLGLVSRQWHAVDWADFVTVAITMTERASQLHHENAPTHSTALVQASSAKHHITQVCQLPYSLYLAPCDFGLFPKPKLLLKWRRSVNAAITAHKLSQRHLTADWLAPWESDCSWMHIKVCSSWLSGYIKAIWPILKIFNMAMYFPGGPHMCLWNLCGTGE